MKYFIGVLLLFSLACKQTKKNALPQEWYKIQQGYNDYDSSGFENMVLRLYNDGTYSHYAANFYNFGTWKWNDTTWLTLTPKEGNLTTNQQILEVNKSTNDKFKVQKIKKENGLLLRSKKVSDFLINESNQSKQDPYSKANNLWRIKPTASESLSQIRDRTVKYLNFLKALYQHAIDNKLQVLTIGWYAAPLQMNYANGFRMSYSTEVKDWYACFYNEEEGIEAYKMISGTIGKIKVHEIESKPERNLDILEQMIKVIEVPNN